MAEDVKEAKETQFVRESIPVNFANITELVIKDLNGSMQTRYRTFTKDNIATYLSNPLRYSKDLQAMAVYLYNNSLHFKRLVNYYAKMSTLDHYIEPYGIDFSKTVNEKTLFSNYNKACNLVELMNIKHEYEKALVSAWKTGAFYGFELEGKDTYFIMELPVDRCQVSGMMDGVYTFSFDLGYFDQNPTQLEFYPKEFVSMYNSFRNGGEQWQEVDPSRSVCIKINEELQYDIPPFAGLFFDIFDIEDYKSLRKVSAVLGNYKFIVEKIPMRKDSTRNNDFLIDLKTAGMFHNKTSGLLPDEIAMFTTPFEIDTVEFKRDTHDRDDVEDAERSFYNASGVSQLLFNGSKSTQANLNRSINVDESEVFGTHRQIERIINLKIKDRIKGTYKYRLRILDNTVFNKKENIETLLKSAQYGIPVKSMLATSLGLSPSSIQSMNFLEENILKFSEKFVPLSSSHTQSGDVESTSESGRPEAEEGDLTEKGEEQRERGDNDNRE